jgi:hypothetical protein
VCGGGRQQCGDLQAVVRGGRGGGQVGQYGAVLQAAGLTHGLDPFDPAAALVGLGAALELAHQHCVADSALGGVVRGVDLEVEDVAERPQRLVLLQQPGGEVRGLDVPAGGALLEQHPDLRSQRRQLGAEPVQVVAVGEELSMHGDHLARELDELDAAAAGRPGALGDRDQLADHVTPAKLLLEDVKEVIAAVAIRHDEGAEVLAEQLLRCPLGSGRVDPKARH